MLRSYFIAGLKPLHLGAKVPISVEEFMNRARDTLAGSLLEDLELLHKNREQMHWDQRTRRQFYKDAITNAHTEFLAEFAKATVNVYEVVAAMLAKRAGLSRLQYQDEHAGHFDSTALMIEQHYDEAHFGLLGRHNFMKVFAEAQALDDPLELELAVAKHFIACADSYAGNDEFSAAAVLAYYIKLEICERFQSFDEERGSAILTILINSIRGALA